MAAGRQNGSVEDTDQAVPDRTTTLVSLPSSLSSMPVKMKPAVVSLTRRRSMVPLVVTSTMVASLLLVASLKSSSERERTK